MTVATTSPVSSAATAPAQGSNDSPGAGITGGYTGDNLTLKIFIAFLLGLSLYNALELLVLILLTFKKFSGLYFWSLIVAGVGIFPYALGFLIKYFSIINPETSAGYVAVVVLSVGWWMMVTGQSVVLWSRLHLVLNNQRTLNWTLYMIIFNALIFHITTTVLSLGSNATTLSPTTSNRFVHGYNVMEKIQMTGFFVQEMLISFLYIRETLKLLKISSLVEERRGSRTEEAQKRRTMYQLLAINGVIVIMDCGLLAAEMANFYIIQTTLKGVVYSVKLKLEFAVLGKMVQFAKAGGSGGSVDRGRSRKAVALAANDKMGKEDLRLWPDFVDRRGVAGDFTHAEPLAPVASRGSRRSKMGRTSVEGRSWIEDEMDRHNID